MVKGRMMAQYSKLQESEIREILSRYELKVIYYAPIEGGAGNSSYFVRTTHKQYILTVFEIENFRIVNLCKLLRLLEEYGFPTTRVQKLANGYMVTSFQGKPVLVKPYITGQMRRDLDENMVRQVGSALARLHKIPSPEFLPGQHAYGLETFPTVMERGIDPGYENWLAQRYDILLQTIPTELPRGLIHGDVFFDNVLFEGETFKALIDFEDACHYLNVFDLGMASVGLCTKDSKVSLSKIRSLVNGYQQVRVLEPKEKEFLQLYVEYAAIATSSWRFWKYNIVTPITEKSDIHYEMVNIAKDVKGIPEAEFMNSVFE
jgi:homoserine kinase type II